MTIHSFFPLTAISDDDLKLMSISFACIAFQWSRRESKNYVSDSDYIYDATKHRRTLSIDWAFPDVWWLERQRRLLASFIDSVKYRMTSFELLRKCRKIPRKADSSVRWTFWMNSKSVLISLEIVMGDLFRDDITRRENEIKILEIRFQPG